MVNRKIVWLSFFLAISLVNCAGPNTVPSKGESNTAESSNANTITISGVVEFPKKFSTKATQTNVASKATVSLIYPPDYSVEALRNVTITGGYTDASGRFTLSANHSFIPQTDDVLILEATKRIGGAGNNSLSLRTLMKWNGNTFQSITTPGIYVNSKTTGLSIISSLDNSFEDISTIGSMTISNNGITNFTDINENVTGELMDSVKGLVEEALDKNLDPVAVIEFRNGTYFINSNGLNNVLFAGCVGDISVCIATSTPLPTGSATSSPSPTASPTPAATATPSPEPTASPTPEATPSASPEPTPTPCGGYGNPCTTPTPTATPEPPTIINITSFTYTNPESTFVSDTDGNGIKVDNTVVNAESGELISIATASTVIDLSEASSALLTFTHKGNQVSDTYNSRRVEYSLNGTDWTILAGFSDENIATDTSSFNLESLIGNETFHLRFRSIVTNQDIIPEEGEHYWKIYNISVTISH